MNDNEEEYALIGHTHAHVSAPYWSDLLLRDIDMVLPVIYAMAGKLNDVSVSIKQNYVINIDNPDQVYLKEFNLDITKGGKSVDLDAFYQACDRLNLSHIIDHWFITKSIETIISKKQKNKVIIGISMQSIASKHLWEHVKIIAKNNPFISEVIIFNIYVRNYIYNPETIDPWFYFIRKLNFQIGLDCGNIMDPILLKIANNCPEFMFFNIDNIIKNRIDFDICEEKIYHSLKNVAQLTNCKIIAKGVDSINLSSSAYSLGYRLQNGKYWNFEEQDCLVKTHESKNNNDRDQINSVIDNDDIKFFKGVLCAIPISLVIWISIIFI